MTFHIHDGSICLSFISDWQLDSSDSEEDCDIDDKDADEEIKNPGCSTHDQVDVNQTYLGSVQGVVNMIENLSKVCNCLLFSSMVLGDIMVSDMIRVSVTTFTKTNMARYSVYY